MIYDVNENSSLSSISHSSRSITSSENSITRVQKFQKTKKLLEMLLSSGSFYDQCKGLNVFLLYPKLYRRLKKSVSKSRAMIFKSTFLTTWKNVCIFFQN